MITIDRTFLSEDGLPDDTLLLEVIKAHDKIREQFRTLQELYLRNHDINARVRLSGLPNNKLVHDYPGYIVTIARRVPGRQTGAVYACGSNRECV